MKNIIIILFISIIFIQSFSTEEIFTITHVSDYIIIQNKLSHSIYYDSKTKSLKINSDIVFLLSDKPNFINYDKDMEFSIKLKFLKLTLKSNSVKKICFFIIDLNDIKLDIHNKNDIDTLYKEIKILSHIISVDNNIVYNKNLNIFEYLILDGE